MQQRILVGTDNGLYEVHENRYIQFTGREVKSLASNAPGWWAIINHQEIWQSGINGVWAHIASIDSAKANCLLVTMDGLFIGTSEAHLLVLKGKTFEIVRSFEEVQGRQNWYTPWGGPPDVRSISADPTGTIYVNVHVGGILRSTDGGKSWQPTIDIHADVHQVIFDPDSGLVLAASALGLGISDDGGESWQFVTDGLHGNYLRAVAVIDRTVFVTASTGPTTNRAAIYRKSLDEGASFERCRQGLPEWFSDNINTFCLAASDSCISFGTSDGFVFVSLDKGQNWSVAAKGLQPVRCMAFA
ncbi:MAG: hypothetical protein QY317_07205 [Candidatus Jettenia caeni]|nr:MAG: hypothetical protein QY317_07205 [Candidatus Jettenia caeni]